MVEISIADGYKIDKTIFNDKGLRAILAGLLSLDSVTQDLKYRKIIDKFSLEKKGIFAISHILIDLSSHEIIVIRITKTANSVFVEPLTSGS